MAEYSDHLSVNEKVLLDGGVRGVHRARVIAQVVVYSEALGLDEISMQTAVDLDAPAPDETEVAQLVVGRGIAYLESMIGPIDGIDVSTQDVERICNALMDMADPAAHESTRDVLKGHLLGKSHEDIASETNISVGVVRRAHQALMSWFDDYAQSQLKDAVFDALRRP